MSSHPPISSRESGVFAIGQSRPAGEPAIGETTAFDDVDLVHALIDNDPVAWRSFEARYAGLVQRCIGRVTRRFGSLVSADDLAEIYGQFVLSLLANDRKKLRSFDPSRGSRFSSWLGLLAINTAYDHLRSVRRRPRLEPLAETDDVRTDAPDPFDETLHREGRVRLGAVLSTFSERDQEFAELYFAAEMSPDEIADKLGISVKTVYSKRHKIQARLETALAREASGVAA